MKARKLVRVATDLYRTDSGSITVMVSPRWSIGDQTERYYKRKWIAQWRSLTGGTCRETFPTLAAVRAWLAELDR